MRAFGALFELFLDLFGPFSPILGVIFTVIFGIFFVMFCEVDCKIKQNYARQGENMQISAKFNKNMQHCAKASPYSAIKKTCFD